MLREKRQENQNISWETVVQNISQKNPQTNKQTNLLFFSINHHPGYINLC